MPVFFPYLLAGLIAMQASSANGQTDMQQLPLLSRGDISVDQASAAEDRPSTTAGQISSNQPSTQEANTRQISKIAPADANVDQLASRDRTNAQDGSISSPAAGRTARTEVPTGPDRCDPEAQRAQPEICRNVIETRSAEFEGPRRLVLSPEEKLLAERSDVARPRTLLNAVRSAGQSGSAGDEGSQVLASLIPQGPSGAQPSQSDGPDDTKLGTETQALIEAILGGLTNQRPPNP